MRVQLDTIKAVSVIGVRSPSVAKALIKCGLPGPAVENITKWPIAMPMNWSVMAD
jgi:hypothetical protein